MRQGGGGVLVSNFAGDDQSPGVSGRLAAVAQHLIEFGTQLHQIGPKLFEHLVAPDTDARSRIFRAGLGVRGPRSRREASALADYAERGVRGPRDYIFEKRLLVAHLLNQLMQCCCDGAEELREAGRPVTAVNLRRQLAFAVGNARPRSDIVPMGISALEVEQAIPDVVGLFLRGRAR